MAHRTQLYLDDAQHRYLKNLAGSQGKSVARIIREWIDEKRKKRALNNYKNDPFFKLRGIFDSGVSDMAKHFDDYLYGDKK